MFILIGLPMAHLGSAHGSKDFAAIYYPARCLMHHLDPYLPANVWSTYQSEILKSSSVKPTQQDGIFA